MMPRHHRSRVLPTGAAVAAVVLLVLALLLIVGVTSALMALWPLLAGTICSTAWLAVPALPLPNGWRRAVRWLRLRLLRWHMRETQRQIDQYRRLLIDDSVKLDALRDRLSQQQRRQLDVASRR